MTEIVLPKLHAGQRTIYRNRDKFNVIRCGRRFGKTAMMETMAANWALHGQRCGFFFPDYKRALPSFDNLLSLLAPVIRRSSREYLNIELVTGGHVEVWSMVDENVARSRKFHHVLIDEGGMVGEPLEDIFRKSILPTTLDYDGDVIMSGTPMGVNEDDYFYRSCTDRSLPEGWKEFHAPSHANPHISAAALARLEKQNDPRVWQQEYLAQWVSWAGAALFDTNKLLHNGRGIDYPLHTECVFAVLDTAVKTGEHHDGSAVLYLACNYVMGNGPPLTILDYDIRQIEGASLTSWLPSIYQRLNELCDVVQPIYGSFGLYVEDKQSGAVLLQYARERNYDVRPIDSKLTQKGKDARCLDASSFVFQGKVLISQYALDKTVSYKGSTKNHLLSQVRGFIVGDKQSYKRQDDLLDTFAYSVLLGQKSSEYY